MRLHVVAPLLLAVGAACAATSTTTTVRLGSRVISAGDSQHRVLEAGGAPSHRKDVLNRFGTKIGEEWTYTTGNGSYTVILFDADGVVFTLKNVVD